MTPPPTVSRWALERALNVNGETVLKARRMMREGQSMTSAAIALGVRSGELDRALWAYIAEDDEALEPVYIWPWEPDFD